MDSSIRRWAVIVQTTPGTTARGRRYVGWLRLDLTGRSRASSVAGATQEDLE